MRIPLDSLTGKMFAWGCRDNGRLGLGPKPRNAPIAQELPKQVYDAGLGRDIGLILRLACGRAHTAAVNDAGEVYTFGHGLHGKLGHGEGEEDTILPRLVRGLEGLLVTAVACGVEHTVLCLRSGDAYSFGLGENARLGHGTKESLYFPKLVRRLRERMIHVVDVVAAGCETVLRTEMGELLTFGDGAYLVADDESTHQKEWLVPSVQAEAPTSPAAFVPNGGTTP